MRLLFLLVLAPIVVDGLLGWQKISLYLQLSYRKLLLMTQLAISMDSLQKAMHAPQNQSGMLCSVSMQLLVLTERSGSSNGML